MVKILVTYLMKRKEGDLIAQAENATVLSVANKSFEELKRAAAAPERNCSFQELQKVLMSLSKLQGYEFVAVETIEEGSRYDE
jgi:hypothetical protein